MARCALCGQTMLSFFVCSSPTSSVCISIISPSLFPSHLMLKMYLFFLAFPPFHRLSIHLSFPPLTPSLAPRPFWLFMPFGGPPPLFRMAAACLFVCLFLSEIPASSCALCRLRQFAKRVSTGWHTTECPSSRRPPSPVSFLPFTMPPKLIAFCSHNKGTFDGQKLQQHKQNQRKN